MGRTNASAEVAANPSVLRERNGNRKAGTSQHTRSERQGAFKDGTAKDNARHEVILPSAFERRSFEERADLPRPV